MPLGEFIINFPSQGMSQVVGLSLKARRKLGVLGNGKTQYALMTKNYTSAGR